MQDLNPNQKIKKCFMTTQVEEQQVREFLKRAEIITMKKDLRALREVDALKERDKIAKLKTLEEQLQDQQAKNQAKASAEQEKTARNEVLQMGETQEKIAEKDLKNYATEQERQQIFLFESQRLGFEKQIDGIDKEKEPKLKLEKNNLLLKLRDWQEKLNSILEQEKKLEDEERFFVEKSQSTTVASEKKSFEASRQDLDKKIQEIEKKRWAVEKQIEDINNNLSEIDKSSDKLVVEKNDLRNKILGIDKSLREIFSNIISREEEKRTGQLSERRTQSEIASKAREEKNENIRRQQWSRINETPVAKNIPNNEEEERKKFLQEVENWSETGSKTDIKKEAKSKEPSIIERAATTTTKSPVVPVIPVPHRKK